MKLIDRFEDVAAIKVAGMTEEEYHEVVDNFVRKQEISYYDKGENTIICDRLTEEEYKKLSEFLKSR